MNLILSRILKGALETSYIEPVLFKLKKKFYIEKIIRMAGFMKMDLVEIVYGTLVHPSSTFRKVVSGNNERNLSVSAIIVLIAVFCSAIGSSVGDEAIENYFEGYPLLQEVYSTGSDDFNLSLPAELLVLVILGFFGWIIASGILHLIAKLFGGRGTFINFLTLMGFSHTPMVFTAPAGLFSIIQAGIAGIVIYGLTVFVLSLWVLVLEIISIKEAYGFSKLKSIFILLAPIIILIGIVFLFVIIIYLVA